MAMNSYVEFSMNNKFFFEALEKIGICFNSDGDSCVLASGEKYNFSFEDGSNAPYLGFSHDFMIGMYLEYFLWCGYSKFNYQFLKIMTENGFFESDYDFENNPFDAKKYYDVDFYKQFHMTKKLTDFDSTIEYACVESIEYDGEITAFRVVVSDNIMKICDLQFELEEDLDCDVEDFWDMMDSETEYEFTTRKTMQNGVWVED